MLKAFARVAAAGTIWAAGSFAALSADFEWKMFTIYGVADKQTDWMRGFAKDVNEATGGRVNITVFSGGELPYKGVDVYRALSKRQIEVGHSPTGFIAPDLPLLDAMSMPFACMDMQKFFTGALPKIRPAFDQAISEKFNVTPVIHWAMPGQELWSTRPVTTIEDFKGMKIRTWNQGQVSTLDKIGANSISITTAEVTPALQRGVIDGAITASVNADAWKWSEVLKNGYIFNITLSHEVISVNSDAMNELPEDLRKAVVDVAAKWEGKFREEVTKLDEQARASLVEQGMTLTDPTPEDAKALVDMTADIGASWAEAQGEVATRVLADIREACH
jgi:TRAP-type C4-dicarboxylate transport system substrate-binding protein